uniref:Phospholipase A2 n=1 Tax=Ciona intestinalis TaxID=7719 RepID=F6ZRG6_CIOIN|nr:basic phospholipase A2 taipoxin alpha chain-like isoform X2 [Ciona intestinalis]|eukprot:XP_002127054.1 basic phospholipase A2 taipoxin alpha chain-like isoform X2 [Ciona intestinalis]
MEFQSFLAMFSLVGFVTCNQDLLRGSFVKKHETSRHRRSIWQFGVMVQCAEGLDHQFPMWTMENYNDYGCHCGMGGKGDPLDVIDECCMEHDSCYKETRLRHKVWKWQIYFTHYNYQCHGKRITCYNGSSWKQDLCQCDVKAAGCFATNRAKYNRAYKDIDQGRCFHMSDLS